MPTLKGLLIYAHMRNRIQRPLLHPTRYTAVQDAIDRVKRTAK
ncbi:MAG: hypothetical protein OXD43_00680 [Bacteroidetes bacterium]|nr:hypothetical protein [Bacteroidota bacterium]